MTTEADALVRELEDQRAFGLTRAARYAARIAARDATDDTGSVEAEQLRTVLTQAETPRRRRSDR